MPARNEHPANAGSHIRTSLYLCARKRGGAATRESGKIAIAGMDVTQWQRQRTKIWINGP